MVHIYIYFCVTTRWKKGILYFVMLWCYDAIQTDWLLRLTYWECIIMIWYAVWDAVYTLYLFLSFEAKAGLLWEDDYTLCGACHHTNVCAMQYEWYDTTEQRDQKSFPFRQILIQPMRDEPNSMYAINSHPDASPTKTKKKKLNDGIWCQYVLVKRIWMLYKKVSKYMTTYNLYECY